jgi:hypothetical protein
VEPKGPVPFSQRQMKRRFSIEIPNHRNVRAFSIDIPDTKGDPLVEFVRLKCTNEFLQINESQGPASVDIASSCRVSCDRRGAWAPIAGSGASSGRLAGAQHPRERHPGPWHWPRFKLAKKASEEDVEVRARAWRGAAAGMAPRIRSNRLLR